MTTLDTITVTAADPHAGRKAQECFAEHGVVVVRGAIPAPICAEVASHLRRSFTAVDEVLAEYGLAVAAPGAGARAAELVLDPALPAAHRHLLQGHFPLAARLDQVSWAIPVHLDATPFVRDLLGTDALFAHMPPMFRFVLPGNSGAAVPAHRDTSYNAHLGAFCTVWVPFVEIDGFCSGMAVYPGTHRTVDAAPLTGAQPAGWLPPVAVDGAERIELHPLSPGDIVVMDRTTIHESMPNRSNRVRLSADFRFFGDAVPSSKHYLDIARRTLVAPAAAQARAS